MQDSKGFIWFGTDAGANRFNGNYFEQFTVDDGLSDNEVLRIHEDSKGRIWFLTYNGKLSYYYKEKFFNTENDSILKQASVSSTFVSFYEDSKGNIWLGTAERGIVVIRKDKVGRLEEPDNKLSDNYNTPYEDCRNRIWLFGDQRYIVTERGLMASSLPYAPEKFRSQIVAKGEMIFLSSQGVVWMKDTVQQLLLPYNNTLNEVTVNFVNKTPSGQIWISTKGEGTFKLFQSKDSTYTRNFLPGKIINYVAEDNERNLWFTTTGEGVYLLTESNSDFTSYTSEDGLLNNQLFSLAQDHNGNIWMGCNNGVVALLKGSKINNFKLSSAEQDKLNRILGLSFDNQNRLWCIGDREVSRINTDLETSMGIVPVSIHGLQRVQTPCKDICVNKSGTVFVANIWGLLKEDKLIHSSVPALRSMDSIPSIRTYSLFFDHSDNLWISNIEGLHLIRGRSYISYGKDNSLLSKRMVDIKETIDSTIILSTDGYGIIFFKDGKIIRHFTEADGLSSNVCRKVFVHGKQVWISTNKGLTRIHYYHGDIGEPMVFNSSHGLSSNDVRDVLDDGKKVYVATGEGLCIMSDLNKAPEPVNPPLVYFTSVKHNQTPIKYDSSVGLSYHENQLSVSFIAITYQIPDQVEYEYTINNGTWNETHNNSIELSNLSPGSYTFFLRAKKINSPWSDPIKFSFSILPLYYQTWWFKALVTNALIVLTFFLIRYFFRQQDRKLIRQLERQTAINNERGRIASDIHDDLGSELTSIALQSQILKKEMKHSGEVSRYLDSINASSQEVIDKMGEIIWALNTSNDTLQNLIGYIREYTNKYLDQNDILTTISQTKTFENKTVSAVYRRNIFLVVKEALHNVVKHSHANHVCMSMDIQKNHFVITITDNGTGLSHEKHNDNGQGMKNMSNRLEEIKGSIHFSSPGEGTMIAIDIPL